MGLDWKKLSELLFPDIEKTPADYEAQYPPRQLPEGAVVTRMAPSPTGFVHLGNLVQGWRISPAACCFCVWRILTPNARWRER